MEIAVKKLFFIVIALPSIIGIQTAQVLGAASAAPILYLPAQGPLRLGDEVSFNARNIVPINRGAIMHAIINDPKLIDANAAIAAFDKNSPPNFRSYQQILDNINQSTDYETSLKALCAIEDAIMHLYDYKVYALGSHKRGISIFFTGIKWSWLLPNTYFNSRNWTSDNDPELSQLIDELSQIATITQKHSPIASLRMKATIQSYKHWRRNLAISTLVYLSANLVNSGWKDSSLNELTHGLTRLPTVAKNLCFDTGNAILAVTYGVTLGTRATWKLTKPVRKFILYGKDFKNDTINLQAPNATPEKIPSHQITKKPQPPTSYHITTSTQTDTIAPPQEIDTPSQTEITQLSVGIQCDMTANYTPPKVNASTNNMNDFIREAIVKIVLDEDAANLPKDSSFFQAIMNLNGAILLDKTLKPIKKLKENQYRFSHAESHPEE